MTRQTTHEARSRRKTTLFCWECAYSSPVDGEWIRRPHDDTVAYVCPQCETTITTRPRRCEHSSASRARRGSIPG
ncbi:hypothetical protein B2G88_03700 [Natronolimnobius baerhuensis]|uniref:DUF8106 domain-containing protein n=1 Tax=Natronolimnobius baerhuensis TaxID=253108 RepID=A0A202ECG8_9EURY|nr:hypothetical protein B2G88_03700 [Natronolimnobius baerhuensis]